MRRWVAWISLVLLAAVVGYLAAALFVPRSSDESDGPTVTIVKTMTIEGPK